MITSVFFFSVVSLFLLSGLIQAHVQEILITFFLSDIDRLRSFIIQRMHQRCQSLTLVKEEALKIQINRHKEDFCLQKEQQ